MRADDLNLSDLLEVEEDRGLVHFAGQRAIILNSSALGILRAELIATIGMSGARGVLTRFGYAHGWQSAETLKRELPWDSERDWRTAGGRLHALSGVVTVEPVVRDPKDGPVPFAESIWRDSYEAEQHLLHCGQAEEAVCWTLTGFASGYLSYVNGRKIYCIEERCRGKGDAVCHMKGQSLEEWGPSIEPHLPFFREKCLEASLRELAGALKHTETQLQKRRRALGARKGDEPSGIVAKSSAMQRVVDLAQRVAKVDSTVLITGESGAGKERIARLIHEQSERLGGPFVAVNCGALTETLLESELFGHARGAFTGATQDRAGLFEAAALGTLFLDEIGEVSPAMQVRLLRALQERAIRRVGENKDRPVNVRVVAATNRKLEDEVARGAFRQDLYYRLRVVELRLPPLRERKEDVLPLARALLSEIAQRTGRPVMQISPQAADRLLRYGWPGNVRELQNALERAVVLAEGTRLEPSDLPEEVRSPNLKLVAAQNENGDATLAAIERAHILKALEEHGGNQTRTARALGIGTATLYRKLRSYGAPRKARG
jgi:two-component system, NtrC family, response regulator HydG